MNPELKTKLAQVRALLKAQKADAALLGLQPNFSWLACGGEAHIPLNSNLSFGQLVVTAKGFYLFANRIEMRCLQDEVVNGLGAKPLLCEWHDNASALNYVGYTWAEKGQNLDEAEKYITRALELRPSDADAYFSYSRFLASRGRLVEAIAQLGRAVHDRRQPAPVSISISHNQQYN